MSVLLTPDELAACLTPTNRYRECYQESGPLGAEYVEVELTGQSLDELATSWGVFYAFVAAERRLVWMGGDAFVTSSNRPYNNLGASPFKVYKIEGDNQIGNMFVWAISATRAVPLCDFLLKLLAQSEIPSTVIQIRCYDKTCHLPLSGEALSQFLECCADVIIRLEIFGGGLNQCHVRAMARARPRLDIQLRGCTILGSATESFLECYDRNCGPTDLCICPIDVELIATILQTSQRLRRLSLSSLDDDKSFRSLFEALAMNKSLRVLDISCIEFSDQNWSLLCESLAKHPTLVELDLGMTIEENEGDDDDSYASISDERKIRRTQSLAKLLQINTVVKQIFLSDSEYDVEVHQELVEPRLERNCELFEKERKALKKAPYGWRPQLLGRAVAAVRYNRTLVWQFLAENVDVVASAPLWGDE